MIHGFTDAPLSAVLQITTDSSTRSHDKKLMKSHCHTDFRLYFFSARVINRWNSLTQAIVDATSVNAFKRHLDDLRQNKMGFFMYRKQDRRNKHIQFKNIKKKTRPKTFHMAQFICEKKTKDTS